MGGIPICPGITSLLPNFNVRELCNFMWFAKINKSINKLKKYENEQM